VAGSLVLVGVINRLWSGRTESKPAV
jgi:hypothetical protein